MASVCHRITERNTVNRLHTVVRCTAADSRQQTHRSERRFATSISQRTFRFTHLAQAAELATSLTMEAIRGDSDPHVAAPAQSLAFALWDALGEAGGVLASGDREQIRRDPHLIRLGQRVWAAARALDSFASVNKLRLLVIDVEGFLRERGVAVGPLSAADNASASRSQGADAAEADAEEGAPRPFDATEEQILAAIERCDRLGYGTGGDAFYHALMDDLGVPPRGGRALRRLAHVPAIRLTAMVERYRRGDRAHPDWHEHPRDRS